jgi:hypothetical protein
MVSPGVYEHYKNQNRYRVLFIATWADYERPQPDDDVLIYFDGSRLSAVSGHRRPSNVLMTVKWSGNPCDPNSEAAVDAGDGVVIYVSLSEHGRLSARTEMEFMDKLPGDLHVERFRRIGS